MQHKRGRAVRDTFVYDWDRVPVIVDTAMVCQLLGMSDATVKRLCASGELPARKIGKMWRINRDDLKRYMGVST